MKFLKIPIPWGHTSYDSYNVDYELFVRNALENPFIQAPFREFLTDLKALKFEVRKNGKVSESSSAKFVMNSLKRPHKELSFSDFIEAIATYLIVGGRCLLFKSQGILSKNIYIYSPNSFIVKRDDRGINIEQIILGDTDVMGNDLKNYHFVKMFDPNESIAGKGYGYSQIKSLAMVGDMLNYLLLHNNNLLKNGGRISGIFRMSTKTSSSQLEEIKNKLGAQSGVNEAGKIAFIKSDEDNAFTPFSTNPKDLDWVNGMVELQKIICRVMGVPEALIMSENSSYNNLEGFKKKIYQDTIIPFANKICEELTELFRDELGEGEEIQINTSNIKALQIGISEEIKKWAEALDGKITTNEFIEFINKAFDLAIPTLKGGEGNRVLVSSNMMFLDELGANYEPTPKETFSQQG